mmetsp:Transcript_52082/g.134308  ORF Transcript_52082/g.134308 Transcript_52082/m.134308 type:complete len:141 (-) Transcript_52082:1234-1656(-)
MPWHTTSHELRVEPRSLGTERARCRACWGNHDGAEKWMNVFLTVLPTQPSSASIEGDISADHLPARRISGVEAGGSGSSACCTHSDGQFGTALPGVAVDKSSQDDTTLGVQHCLGLRSRALPVDHDLALREISHKLVFSQ